MANIFKIVDVANNEWSLQNYIYGNLNKEGGGQIR